MSRTRATGRAGARRDATRSTRRCARCYLTSDHHSRAGLCCQLDRLAILATLTQHISYKMHRRSALGLLRPFNVSSYSPAVVHIRSYSALPAYLEDSKSSELSPEEKAEREARFRQRKTEWKRRQGVRSTLRILCVLCIDNRMQGQTFLDHMVLTVRAGHSLNFPIHLIFD